MRGLVRSYVTLAIIHALYNSLEHTLYLFSLLCLHRLWPGNGFQRCSFLNFHVHALTGRRLSPNQLNTRLALLVTPRHGLHSKNRFQQFYCCVTQLSHGPRREHLIPISPLLRVRNLLSINDRCLHSRYLAMGLHATVPMNEYLLVNGMNEMSEY
jgi:hypothetical protein